MGRRRRVTRFSDEELAIKLNQRKSMKRFALSINPVFAARELYTQMREASNGHEELLLCEVPLDFNAEKWRAIRDRLTRASRQDLRPV